MMILEIIRYSSDSVSQKILCVPYRLKKQQGGGWVAVERYWEGGWSVIGMRVCVGGLLEKQIAHLME